MKHTLIPHPRLNLAAPIVSLRELMLAAQGLQHKAASEARAQTIRVLSVQLCAAEELTRQLGTLTAAQAAKIADLKQRNAELTTALHRQASAGFVAMDYLVTAAPLIMLATAVPVIGWVGALYIIGSLVIGAGLMLYFTRRICEFWDDHHMPIAPAGEHLPEPGTDARIEYPAMGEAYANESFPCWEDEILNAARVKEKVVWAQAFDYGTLTHPEALTRQLNEAIHSPAAEAARARFEADADAIHAAWATPTR